MKKYQAECDYCHTVKGQLVVDSYDTIYCMKCYKEHFTKHDMRYYLVNKIKERENVIHK